MTINHDNETLKNNVFYKVYKEGLAHSFSKILKSRKSREGTKMSQKPPTRINDESPFSGFNEIELIRSESMKKTQNLGKSTFLKGSFGNVKKVLEMKDLEIAQLQKIIQKLNKGIEIKENYIEKSLRYHDIKDLSITSRDGDSNYFNKSIAIQKNPHIGDEEIYEEEDEKTDSFYRNLKIQSYFWGIKKKNLTISDDEHLNLHFWKECYNLSQFFEIKYSVGNKTDETLCEVDVSFTNSESYYILVIVLFSY